MPWLKAELDEDWYQRLKALRDERGFNNIHETASTLLKIAIEDEEL